MAQLYWRVKRDGKWVLQAVILPNWLIDDIKAPGCECTSCDREVIIE